MKANSWDTALFTSIRRDLRPSGLTLLIFGALCLFGSGRTAFAANAASLYPSMDASKAPAALESDSGRNLERETAGSTEFQRTCPQSVGDAWDTTSDQAWNILEIGVQVRPEQTPAPKLQLYTRYTCAKPLDRPTP